MDTTGNETTFPQATEASSKAGSAGSGSAPASAASASPASSTPDLKGDHTSRLLIGNLCMLVAALFWGLNVSVTKALYDPIGWMTPHSIVIVRLIGGAILFWIASAFVKCESIEKSDWLKLILGGFIGLFGFIFLFIQSLEYGSAIDISIIMTLPPIFVILIGVIFLHRRPGWMEYVGVAVSFVGAAIVILGGADKGHISSHSPHPILGDCLAIASTICYAFYLTILEGPTKKYKPVGMLRWIFLFAAIPSLFLLKGFDELPLFTGHAPALPWIYITFILVGPTFIAYFLVQPAMKRIGSELVSIYQYLLPVFATISAIFMIHEKLHWIQVLAMGVIVIGMLFTTFGKRRRVKKEGQDDV